MGFPPEGCAYTWADCGVRSGKKKQEWEEGERRETQLEEERVGLAARMEGSKASVFRTKTVA